MCALTAQVKYVFFLYIRQLTVGYEFTDYLPLLVHLLSTFPLKDLQAPTVLFSVFLPQRHSVALQVVSLSDSVMNVSWIYPSFTHISVHPSIQPMGTSFLSLVEWVFRTLVSLGSFSSGVHRRPNSSFIKWLYFLIFLYSSRLILTWKVDFPDTFLGLKVFCRIFRFLNLRVFNFG